MKIKVKLVSMPGHQPPGFDEFGNAVMVMKDDDTILTLLGRLKLSDLETYLVLVNGETVPPGEHSTYVFRDGDEAAVFPPMEGGKV